MEKMRLVGKEWNLKTDAEKLTIFTCWSSRILQSERDFWPRKEYEKNVISNHQRIFHKHENQQKFLSNWKRAEKSIMNNSKSSKSSRWNMNGGYEIWNIVTRRKEKNNKAEGKVGEWQPNKKWELPRKVALLPKKSTNCYTWQSVEQMSG